MTMTATTAAAVAGMSDIARRPLSGGSGDELTGLVARHKTGVVA